MKHANPATIALTSGLLTVLVLACQLAVPLCTFAAPATRMIQPAGAHPGDQFGHSVAIDQAWGLVGAPGDDQAGEDAGAAYLVDLLSGQVVRKFLAQDAHPGDAFGWSVALHGNVGIVGALASDESGLSSGSAYLYDLTTGAQLYKLAAQDGSAHDEFGVSVAVSDQLAVVGAHMAGSGATYVFDAASGQQLRKLVSLDAEQGDLFGVAVALDGTTALIGARYDDDGAIAAGSAYLFDAASGQQRYKLTTHDPEQGDRFGQYVDISGNTAIVAARYDDDDGKSSGSAYLFDVDTGRERLKLTASDAQPGNHFGSSVSVSGPLAIVGAAIDNDHGLFSGSAYLFDVDTGQQLEKLTAPDGQAMDMFGHAVALDGSWVMIGSPQLAVDTPISRAGAGKVYIMQVVPEPSSLALWIAAALLCPAPRWVAVKRRALGRG